MASASRCPPWIKENPDQQFLVNKSHKYSEMLRRNTADLCETVRIGDLWIFLISLGVINDTVKARLQSRLIDEDQVAALLDYLLSSPCWKLHGFLRALCLADQAYILSQVLHLDPQEYKGKKNNQDQAAHLKQWGKEIKEHRDVYHRILMQGSLFDIPSLDLPYNMEPCYIQLVATEDGFLRNPEDILPADILKPRPGKPRPRTALLSGPPGAGKSSFIKFYVYRWCQKEDGSSDWDLIIILNVSTLRLTPGLLPKDHIKEAIQQSLEGRGDKEAIMKSLDDDSLDILIIPDGLDECRSPTTLEMLKELISSCHKGKLGFTVLSTCRSGLSPIMDSLYDRRMKLDGFKTHEGVEYVKRFYQEIQKPADESTFDYIANSAEELNHILTNPLCTHILSIVTADGTLKLVKGQRLQLKELFYAMERSMRRRQLEKMLEGGSESVLNEGQLEEEIKCFYNMCLWSLLKGVRTFDDELLSLFKINSQHPYFTFLKKIKSTSFLKQVFHWKFNHETFHEYFSVCALEVLPNNILSALLLTISSDKKFRNTQRILFSALGWDIDHVGKLSDMICMNLITHSDTQRPCSNLDSTTQRIIDDIKEKAKTGTSQDDLLNTLIPGRKDNMIIDTSNTKALWQTIRSLYEKDAELLQKRGLLYHTATGSKDLIKHIYNCLQEVPEEHQQLVFEQSLGCILPSTGVDFDGTTHILYTTGGTRWSDITVYRQSVKLGYNIKCSVKWEHT